ncbi:SDR family oxidoreductase [Arsenicitalea aurantiaca]|uniref:SDR family oxidoreductase n=1 Tax=Arsenicitalea aurantiaca TaxID=1783274 RepID=A0A433XL94_9HYPH|nr:SDR family oxidoreductase [Arsenicitalea aurantiaca]RUT34857.1 SDR family oxidoreductase [Arsenicitalea aurantiaca]
MDVTLSGKILLVTGSTQGVGEKVARLAIASGAAGVLITGRSAERGEALASELGTDACPVEFIAADLADPAAPELIAASAVSAFGRIDCLVNSAGLTDRASLLDGTPALWERLFAVNARAPFFLMQHAVADMISRRAPGSIVNILSVNAHCGAPDLSIYSASKGALSTLTRNVAHAHLPDRIRCNGINMGWATTPGEHKMQGETLGKGAGWVEEAAAGMPLKRLLTDDEVAQLTIFLLSDQSGLMTGTLIDMEQAVLGAPPRRVAN